jgi:excisionase family DNA binding protein
MKRNIIQIQELEPEELTGRLEKITKELQLLRTELSSRKEPADYITRQEVAAMLHVTLPTVHDWIKKGILKSYKIANRVFLKRGEVETALTQVSPRHRSN